MKEGYPERVCDYCQSQLNTFHAFVRKAKNTSNQFESMLQEMKQDDDDEEEDNEPDDGHTNSELLSTTDMEFEDGVDDTQEKHSNQSIKVEFIVENTGVGPETDRNAAVSSNSEEGVKLSFGLKFE